MSIGPYLQANGMYYVCWTSSAGKIWERWFHTEAVAERWLAEMQAEHP
jgi:hypothetical protein